MSVIVVLYEEVLIGVYSNVRELNKLKSELVKLHGASCWEDIKDEYNIYWSVLINNIQTIES